MGWKDERDTVLKFIEELGGIVAEQAKEVEELKEKVKNLEVHNTTVKPFELDKPEGGVDGQES